MEMSKDFRKKNSENADSITEVGKTATAQLLWE